MFSLFSPSGLNAAKRKAAFTNSSTILMKGRDRPREDCTEKEEANGGRAHFRARKDDSRLGFNDFDVYESVLAFSFPSFRLLLSLLGPPPPPLTTTQMILSSQHSWENTFLPGSQPRRSRRNMSRIAFESICSVSAFARPSSPPKPRGGPMPRPSRLLWKCA